MVSLKSWAVLGSFEQIRELLRETEVMASKQKTRMEAFSDYEEMRWATVQALE